MRAIFGCAFYSGIYGILSIYSFKSLCGYKLCGFFQVTCGEGLGRIQVLCERSKLRIVVSPGGYPQERGPLAQEAGLYASALNKSKIYLKFGAETDQIFFW